MRCTCTRAGSTPRPRHQPSASALPNAYPLVGVTAPPSRLHRSFVERLPRDELNQFRLPGLLMVPAYAPALQRIVGLMPGRSGVSFDPPDRLPV
jgi:hypothetical protein